MKKYSVKTSAIGLLLLSEALTCSALTLGRARGAVVLGQPLDIAVPVQMDEGDDIMSLCLDADVAYGDVPQVKGRVTLTPSPAVNGQSASVRIRSSQPVDEPVVAASLRAGCTQKVSRRFVFLADLPSEAAPNSKPAAPSATTPSLPVAAIVPPAMVTVAPGKPPAEVTPPALNRGKAVIGNGRTTPAGGSDLLATSANKTLNVSTKAKPTLKLATVELRDLRDPDLKFTQELFTLPIENSKSAAAAIALWQALNAQPEDVVHDRQRLQMLDADVGALRANTSKNEANLVQLKQRLEAAESERFANGLVYGLVALLLASLVGLFLLWRRPKTGDGQSNSWWQGPGTVQTDQGTIREQGSPRSGPSALGEMPTRTAFVDIDLDLDLGFDESAAVPARAIPTLTDSQVVSLEQSPTPSSATNWVTDRGFSPSMVSALRTTNSEEVVDVRQQAEFFMSLGQNEQAIHMLMDRVDGPDDASPLVYLDLMQLLRRLGRRIDFNEYRDKFNRIFTGKAPEYANFNDKGKDLEFYAEVLAHISAEWSSDLILDILEGCIFRHPDDDLGQPFDLQAFEDLLLLHGVATRLAANSRKA